MTIQALSAHAGFGPFDTRVNTMNTCPILNTPDLTFSIHSRHVSIRDGTRRPLDTCTILVKTVNTDTQRHVSIPGFSVRTRIRVDFPDVDFLDFHVSASCLRPPAVQVDTTNTHRYDAIHDDTRRYCKIHTDTRRYTTTSKCTPI